MLTAEVLIKKEADDFRDEIEPGMRIKSHLDLKDKLTGMLYNYEDNVDKLTFLYRTLNNVDAAYDEHMLVCEYKSTPEKCPKNVHYSQCKLFTEQEIRRLNPSYEYSVLRP